jgi:hypothetical protein
MGPSNTILQDNIIPQSRRRDGKTRTIITKYRKWLTEDELLFSTVFGLQQLSFSSREK